MRYILNFSASVLILAIVLSVIPINGEEGIYDEVIRLHVLANSDTEEDQALKLKVRDAIIEYISPTLEGCCSREEAEELFSSLLPEIERVSEETAKSAGYDYSVTASLGEEKYPTREYGDISLPAGNYVSLRVKIESGEGQNWWCVLFPPLCTSAAMGKKTASEELCIEAGLTPAQYRLITDTDNVRYKLKFKFLEVFADLFGKS